MKASNECKTGCSCLTKSYKLGVGIIFANKIKEAPQLSFYHLGRPLCKCFFYSVEVLIVSLEAKAKFVKPSR